MGSFSIWIVSLILLVALTLLITDRVPVDRTSIGIMVALALSGVLTPQEAVAGFANPAVITVAAMFLISRGLIRTGAVEFVAASVLRFSRGNRMVAVAVILFVVAGASAFINNTPVVVLFIPIVLSLSCEYDMSPSKLLIPVSYASILAGTCTLIGTSTNIIVSDLSAAYGFGKLGMFELASLGVPIALVGLIFILLLSDRMMPGRTAPICELKDREDKRYLAELLVPENSTLIGQEPVAFFESQFTTLVPIEIVRASRIADPFRQHVTMEAQDILLVKGSADDLVAILQSNNVELPHSEDGIEFGPGTENDLIVELIVPPHSSFLRHGLLSTNLGDDPDVHIIAIKSRRLHYTEQKIQNVKLRLGDILLVRCSRKKLEQLRRGNDFIIVEDIHHAIIDKSKVRWALLIFGGVIVATTFGLADIMVCALTGVLLMVITRCFQLRDAYRSLEPDVLLLIVGTIALGNAMAKTGASQLYAESFLDLFKGSEPGLVLAGFILLTSICSQILSNNATAVLLLPIAISTALALGVNPKPFIIGVCFGASACFATPIGYQTNLLVYGPGGYRFSDYLKLGLPLNFLVIAMGALFIPVIWPF
jgi:di/tricarboxylate transporter